MKSLGQPNLHNTEGREKKGKKKKPLSRQCNEKKEES